MSTFVIGDIQGCYDAFARLLERIRFDPARDKLWLVGDLVNRGPQSLEVLRWASTYPGRLRSVLGNHDLHLLALAAGMVRYGKRFNTLQKVLNAPDSGELCHWLRHRHSRYQNR